MNALLFPTRRELCSCVGREREQKQSGGAATLETRASFPFHHPGAVFTTAGDFNQVRLKSVMPKL